MAVDSLWYRKPTLSFWNAIVFYTIRDETALFADDSILVYVNCLFRDNNVVVLIGWYC